MLPFSGTLPLLNTAQLNELVETGKTSTPHQHFPTKLPNFNPPVSVLNTEHLGYGAVHGIVTDMLC
jgi:hypothetical protein